MVNPPKKAVHSDGTASTMEKSDETAKNLEGSEKTAKEHKKVNKNIKLHQNNISKSNYVKNL